MRHEREPVKNSELFWAIAIIGVFLLAASGVFTEGLEA